MTPYNQFLIRKSVWEPVLTGQSTMLGKIYDIFSLVKNPKFHLFKMPGLMGLL